MSSPVRSVLVAGETMTVVDRGDRVPLLFVHGFPLDHAVWEPQVEAFATTRRVIAPDLVGFGGSSVAARGSMDEHADDLAGLLDALGVGRAVVVGLSMGGYVALAMWRRHRSRVAAMVLAASRAGADSDAGRTARYQMAIAVAEEGVGPVSDALLPRLLAADAPPALVGAVREMMHRQPARGVIAALKAMAARPTAFPRLGEINVPALVVAGAADGVVPVEEAESMAQAIPNARLVVIPGAGHLVNLEMPGAFNALLRSFLETVDAPGVGDRKAQVPPCSA